MKQKDYVANLSGGKDSLALCLRLMELGMPLTKAIFYDTGMEFQAVYRNIEKIRPILFAYGCELVVIKPERDFLVEMLLRPVCEGTCGEHYGYEWCGGCTRWRTSGKVEAINKYLSTLKNGYVQYVGIAADEPDRIRMERNKVYPLVDWGWTEKDCLEYCYSKGWNWEENGIELYSILDRVSCWCCSNKNLKELRNMYHFLPYYWGLLKGLQSRIDRPFRSDGATIFDLEKRFQREDRDLEIMFNMGRSQKMSIQEIYQSGYVR